jgi:hypothetical protein
VLVVGWRRRGWLRRGSEKGARQAIGDLARDEGSLEWQMSLGEWGAIDGNVTKQDLIVLACVDLAIELIGS